MVKRFFVAAIVVVLMLSSQIVSAEIPIDWSRVQRVSSKSDLARYIEQERTAGQTVIAVILTNGLTVTGQDFITLCPSSVVSWKTVANDGQNIRVIYTLMEYPGTRVANAYRNNDTTWLNAEEKRLYDEAVKIVNEAKKRNGIINQEVCIYDTIMNRSIYLTGDMSNQPHFVTAYGVLIDGKANCQGYADAFYMLGRMMGWNVGRMSGTAGGGAHAWNWIEINGKKYFVDATWDDQSIKNGDVTYNGYVYFNAPVEIMKDTHSWDWALAPTNLQPSVDNCYSYCFLCSHLARATNLEAGLKFIAQKFKEQNGWCSVMVPFDAKYLDNDNVLKPAVHKTCNECGKNISYNAWKRGGYIFIHTRTY